MTTIARATLSDAEEILLLQKLSYKSEADLYHDDAIPPMIQALKDIQRDFERQTFLKAIVNETIVGSVRAFAQDKTCYIGRLAVHPDFQNQGIGTQLMNAIEDTFKICKRYELFTGYKSEKNITLYQKLGYKIFKTEKLDNSVSLVYLEKYSTTPDLDSKR